MSWRPEGWKTFEAPDSDIDEPVTREDAFETGADAMLEALRKQAKNRGLLIIQGETYQDGKKSITVFIPDEE